MVVVTTQVLRARHLLTIPASTAPEARCHSPSTLWLRLGTWPGRGRLDPTLAHRPRLLLFPPQICRLLPTAALPGGEHLWAHHGAATHRPQRAEESLLGAVPDIQAQVH